MGSEKDYSKHKAFGQCQRCWRYVKEVGDWSPLCRPCREKGKKYWEPTETNPHKLRWIAEGTLSPDAL